MTTTRWFLTSLFALAAAAPASANFVIDFEDVSLGTQLRVPDAPLSSGGVLIDGQEFFWFPSGSTTSGVATIQNNGDAGGSGKEFWTNNINLSLDWGAFSLSSLSFRYGEYGGNINFAVNGDMRNVVDILALDGDTVGGVTVSVSTSDLITGTVNLNGTIDSFSVGGQEFVVDDIVGVPEPASAALLGLIAGVALRRRR